MSKIESDEADMKTLKSNSIQLALTIGLLGLIAAACGKKDADKIGEAQSCLDGATAATALACTEKIDGLESAAAYVIRCQAMFIAEGFDSPERLNRAYQQMSTSGTGSAGANSSIAAMTALAFVNGVDATANQTNANKALEHCKKSESKGLILLSGIANMATNMISLATLASQCTIADPEHPTSAEMTCALGAAEGNVVAETAVGEAAAAAYNANCAAGQTSNQQFCTQFQEAVTASGGTTNSAELGAALIASYCATADPACP